MKVIVNDIKEIAGGEIEVKLPFSYNYDFDFALNSKVVIDILTFMKANVSGRSVDLGLTENALDPVVWYIGDVDNRTNIIQTPLRLGN